MQAAVCRHGVRLSNSNVLVTTSLYTKRQNVRRITDCWTQSGHGNEMRTAQLCSLLAGLSWSSFKLNCWDIAVPTAGLRKAIHVASELVITLAMTADHIRWPIGRPLQFSVGTQLHIAPAAPPAIAVAHLPKRIHDTSTDRMALD